MPNEPIVTMLEDDVLKRHHLNKAHLKEVTIEDVDNLSRALLDRRSDAEKKGAPPRVATCCCCMTCCYCAAAVVPDSL